MTGMIFLTTSFYFAGRYIEGRNLTKSTVSGLLLRSIFYGIIGLFAAVSAGFIFFAAVLILYPLASGLAFAIYYSSSSSTVFNTIGPKNRGSTLGVYSALVGVGTTAESFVSGHLSFYLGFVATFTLATAVSRRAHL